MTRDLTHLDTDSRNESKDYEAAWQGKPRPWPRWPMFDGIRVRDAQGVEHKVRVSKPDGSRDDPATLQAALDLAPTDGSAVLVLTPWNWDIPDGVRFAFPATVMFEGIAGIPVDVEVDQFVSIPRRPGAYTVAGLPTP
jgi:hypothetical protein